MNNILDYSINELRFWMKENGESEFRAKQVFDWLYKGIENFDEMNNIPKKLKNKLNKEFYIGIPKIVKKYNSKLEDTHKFLFKFNDGNLIESVVMKYKYGSTICVSTQVGCRMGCKFCASTVEGMVRNLTSGEMLSQILKCEKELKEKISNVVMMGSGEPLDNYDNIIKFIRLINDKKGLNIGQRHITLSTCGIVPNIIRLADEKLQITLAISLHAPEDSLRKTMMPIANKYSIKDILEACKYYIEKTNRRITFEYALVKGVNDTSYYAKKLVHILKGILCHVNLIPVNTVKENNYKKSSTENIKQFSNILTQYRIENTIRREMGSDINAACGQLRRSYMKSKNI